MITVQVIVPAMSSSYDFNLDEDAPISSIIDEATTLVCLKERWHVPEHMESLELYDTEKCRKLNRSESLYDSGVMPGQRLILC